MSYDEFVKFRAILYKVKKTVHFVPVCALNRATFSACEPLTRATFRGPQI